MKGEKALYVLTKTPVWVVRRIGPSAYLVKPRRGVGFRASEMELQKIKKE